MTARRTVTVRNANGLHARPAMAVVETANRYQSDLTLSRDPQTENGGGEGGEAATVDAKSVMGVITLAATQGVELQLVGDGPDEVEAVEALAGLFESGFGEE